MNTITYTWLKTEIYIKMLLRWQIVNSCESFVYNYNK